MDTVFQRRRTFVATFRRLLFSDDGFGIVEYAVVLSGLCIGVLASLHFLVGAMNTTYGRTT